MNEEEFEKSILVEQQRRLRFEKLQIEIKQAAMEVIEKRFRRLQNRFVLFPYLRYRIMLRRLRKIDLA